MADGPQAPMYRPRRQPPGLGADSNDVLKSLLAHDDAAIEKLRGDGVI